MPNPADNNYNALRDQNRIPVATGQSSTDSSQSLPLKIDPVTGRLLVDSSGGGGSGTVTNVSSATADLTVATPTTTPVLTVVSAPKLTTARTINGVAFDGTTNITVADATKVPTTRNIATTAPLSGGGDLSADRTLTTSMNTNKLIGRGTAAVGVMEEITLGTNLSFTGTTLNASGGGAVAWGAITGTLSNQTDLQTALNLKASKAFAIAMATAL